MRSGPDGEQPGGGESNPAQKQLPKLLRQATQLFPEKQDLRHKLRNLSSIIKIQVNINQMKDLQTSSTLEPVRV